MKVTFFAPAYWIATVWPPFCSTVVCITVCTSAAGAGELAVAAAKLTLPVVWPSTRIWIGQARSAVGFSAVHVALPEKVITAEPVPGVPNEVNAVGI